MTSSRQVMIRYFLLRRVPKPDLSFSELDKWCDDVLSNDNDLRKQAEQDLWEFYHVSDY